MCQSVLEGHGCTWPPRSPDLTVCVISPCGVRQAQCLTSHQFPKTLPELRRAHKHRNMGTSLKTCLREGLGGEWGVLPGHLPCHMWRGRGRTLNVFKVTTKLLIFLFIMVVTSCIYIQYLWKYGFGKSSDNLYTPCIKRGGGLNVYE
jgi:hypothetical protein